MLCRDFTENNSSGKWAQTTALSFQRPSSKELRVCRWDDLGELLYRTVSLQALLETRSTLRAFLHIDTVTGTREMVPINC